MSSCPNRGLPRWIEAPVALVALVGLAPILGLISLLVRTTSRGPAVFRQRRVGRDGRTFTLYKFRTMRDVANGPKVTAAGDPRITAVGRILRRTKLDELPELWNVLVGEMSLVGPRPEVPEAVDLGNPLWRRALAARPGLTDPVTLRLRDEEAILATVPEPERATFYSEVLQPWKLRGYASYLDRRTPWSDLGVLVTTLGAILDPASVKSPTVEELRSL